MRQLVSCNHVTLPKLKVLLGFFHKHCFAIFQVFVSICNDKLSPGRHFVIEWWRYLQHGYVPGTAPMTISPFCLLRVKVVPSEEDSASCGVLADLMQTFIAIGSVNYTFALILPLR